MYICKSKIIPQIHLRLVTWETEKQLNVNLICPDYTRAIFLRSHARHKGCVPRARTQMRAKLKLT